VIELKIGVYARSKVMFHGHKITTSSFAFGRTLLGQFDGSDHNLYVVSISQPRDTPGQLY